MILADDVSKILGTRPCEILQLQCPDCSALCTWVRLKQDVIAVGGCVCNYFRMKEKAETTETGWKSYPPVSC